jgi:hypothetical protein
VKIQLFGGKYINTCNTCNYYWFVPGRVSCAKLNWLQRVKLLLSYLRGLANWLQLMQDKLGKRRQTEEWKTVGTALVFCTHVWAWISRPCGGRRFPLLCVIRHASYSRNVKRAFANNVDKSSSANGVGEMLASFTPRFPDIYRRVSIEGGFQRLVLKKCLINTAILRPCKEGCNVEGSIKAAHTHTHISVRHPEDQEMSIGCIKYNTIING